MRLWTIPLIVTESGWIMTKETAKVHILAMLCSYPEMKKQNTNNIIVNSFAPSPLIDIGTKKAKQTSQLQRIARKKSSDVGNSVLDFATSSKNPFTITSSKSPVAYMRAAKNKAPMILPV